MAHTPGPWRHDREGSRIVSETAFYEYSTPEDPQPVSIVSLFGAMGGDDTAADAALMAAAPAMLAALQNCLANAIARRDAAKVYDDKAGNPSKADMQAEIDEIRAAIAAATGER